MISGKVDIMDGGHCKFVKVTKKVKKTNLWIHFGPFCASLLLSILTGKLAFAPPYECHTRYLIAFWEALWCGWGSVNGSSRSTRSGRSLTWSRTVFISHSWQWRAALKKMGLHQFGKSRGHFTVIHGEALCSNNREKVVLPKSYLIPFSHS